MVGPPFENDAVESVFEALPYPIKRQLLLLRSLVLRVAAETPEVGEVQETLKWGQPAYLTPASRSGTTLRLAPTKSGGYGIFVHCQTTVIADFRSVFDPALRFDGQRGILFDAHEEPDLNAMAPMIHAALTYRLKKIETRR